MTATEPIPARVLAAEQRREFRQLLARSSLGCPNRECEHSIGRHDAQGYDGDGTPIRPVCSAPDCLCGAQEEP